MECTSKIRGDDTIAGVADAKIPLSSHCAERPAAIVECPRAFLPYEGMLLAFMVSFHRKSHSSIPLNDRAGKIGRRSEANALGEQANDCT